MAKGTKPKIPDTLNPKYYMEDVGKEVMVCQILCIISGKAHVPWLWNCWLSIRILCEESGEHGVDIQVISFLPMFKGLSICYCKNLMHKHREDVTGLLIDVWRVEASFNRQERISYLASCLFFFLEIYVQQVG